LSEESKCPKCGLLVGTDPRVPKEERRDYCWCKDSITCRTRQLKNAKQRIAELEAELVEVREALKPLVVAAGNPDNCGYDSDKMGYLRWGYKYELRDLLLALAAASETEKGESECRLTSPGASTPTARRGRRGTPR